MVEQESSETEGSISESLNTSLRTVCLCAVSSLNEETLSQEQQSSSQSKVQPNKHSRKLQVHCSILEDTAALKLSVFQLCCCPLSPLFLVLCVCETLSLLRLMPQTAPALSFIAPHYPLSLSLSFPPYSLFARFLLLPSFPPVMFPVSVAVSPSK